MKKIWQFLKNNIGTILLIIVIILVFGRYLSDCSRDNLVERQIIIDNLEYETKTLIKKNELLSSKTAILQKENDDYKDKIRKTKDEEQKIAAEIAGLDLAIRMLDASSADKCK